MLFISFHTIVLYVNSFSINFYIESININALPISNFLQRNMDNTSLKQLSMLSYGIGIIYIQRSNDSQYSVGTLKLETTEGIFLAPL